MHDLQLVGLTTDRRGLIFRPRAGARTDAGFVVPVTDDLVALVAELADELAAAEALEPDAPVETPQTIAAVEAAAKPRSQMSVRDIQARLRAGEPVTQVAREAGVDEDWIERFAPPIRAEQRRIVDRALEHHLQRARSAPSAVPLRRAVGMALAEKGIAYTVAAFDAAWSAHLLGHERWVVSFTYRHRGRDRTATWTYDAADDELTTSDRTAAQLGYVAPGTAGDDDGQAIDGIIGDPEATNQIGTASPAGRTRRGRSGTTSRSAGSTATDAGAATPTTTRSRPKAAATGRAATKKPAAKKQATPATKRAAASKKTATAKKAATAKKKKATVAKKAMAKKKAAATKAAASKKAAAAKKQAAAKKAATAKKQAAAKKRAAAAKRSPAKKAAAARSAKRTSAKKTSAKKASAKKSPAKKTTAKKARAEKSVAKKAPTPKPSPDEGPVATVPVAPLPSEAAPAKPVEVEQAQLDVWDATASEDVPETQPPLSEETPRPSRDTRRPDERAAPARPVAGRPGEVPIADVPLARRPPAGNGRRDADDRPATAPDDAGVDRDASRAGTDPAAARRARAAERNAPTVQFRSGSAAPVRAAGAAPDGRVRRTPQPEPAADRSRTEPGASNGAARPESRRRRQLRAR